MNTVDTRLSVFASQLCCPANFDGLREPKERLVCVCVCLHCIQVHTWCVCMCVCMCICMNYCVCVRAKSGLLYVNACNDATLWRIMWWCRMWCTVIMPSLQALHIHHCYLSVHVCVCLLYVWVHLLWVCVPVCVIEFHYCFIVWQYVITSVIPFILG